MIKKFNFLLSAAIIFAFAACSDNDNEIPVNPNVDGKGAMVSISIKDAAGTRAPGDEYEDGTAAENAVKKLDFYVFDSEGKYVQTNTFDGALGTYKFVVSPTGTNKMSFLVAVNQATYDFAAETPIATVRAQLSSSTAFTAFESGTDEGNTLAAPTGTGAGTIEDVGFAMTGEALEVAVAPSEEGNESPVTSFSVEVNRLVSKINAPTEKVGGAGLSSDLKTSKQLSDLLESAKVGYSGTFGDIKSYDFILKEYVFINGIDKSDAFRNFTELNKDGGEISAGETVYSWGGWNTSGNKTYINSAFESGKYTKVYGGSKDSDDMFLTSGVIYAYENQPESEEGADGAYYYKKETVYSYIIKGNIDVVYNYVEEGSTDVKDETITITRYWKANLIPKDNHIVNKNTVYYLEVDAINTIGHNTPEEAEKEVVPKSGNASVNVTINVAKWRVRTTTTPL